jgi:hypothetical protein
MRSVGEAGAEAILADPHSGPDALAGALATLTICALARPRLVDSRAVSSCERLLRTQGLTSEVYDRVLGLLAAVIYLRPTSSTPKPRPAWKRFSPAPRCPR